MTLDEVSRWSRPLAIAHSARHILHWIYARGAESFDEIAISPPTLRHTKQTSSLAAYALSVVSRSTDGTHRKILILLAVSKNRSVIIPTDTPCDALLVDQVGCALAVILRDRRMGLAIAILPPPNALPNLCRPRDSRRSEDLTNFLCLHGDGRAACELPAPLRNASRYDFGMSGDITFRRGGYRLDGMPASR